MTIALRRNGRHGEHFFECSECHWRFAAWVEDQGGPRFCPGCGDEFALSRDCGRPANPRWPRHWRNEGAALVEFAVEELRHGTWRGVLSTLSRREAARVLEARREAREEAMADLPGIPDCALPPLVRVVVVRDSRPSLP